MSGHRLREVAVIAFLLRDGHDLSPKLEGGTRSGWRQGGIPNEVGPLGVPRSNLDQVRRDPNRDGTALTRRRLVEVQATSLFVGDLRTAGRGVHDREVGVRRQLLDSTGSRIEREEVELAVTVRAEIHGVADPHRIGVVAAPGRLRYLLDRVVAGVVDPDPGRRPAPVVLPLVEGLVQRRVGDLGAVRRVARLEGVRDGELIGMATLNRHGVELAMSARVGGPGRREEHRRAVYREALDDVAARMPGQPRGHSTVDGYHVDVRVSVVLAAEGERAAVR